MSASVDSTAVDEAVAAEIASLGSPESRRSYEHTWRYFRAWLAEQQLDVLAVKPRHVTAYIAKLRGEGKAKSSMGRAKSVLCTLFGALVREELVATNPAREVKTPRVDSNPKTPWIADAADIEKLLNVPGDSWKQRRDRLVVRLAFGLGWRRAEVARVHAEHVDGETISAPLIKGGKSLTVGLPDWLAEDIFEWRQFAGIQDGPLFPRAEDDRRPISGAIVYRIVRQMCARADIEVVPPHALRRTFITHGGIRRVPLKDRQLSLGHGSSNVTERYDRARDAAASKVGNVFADLIRGDLSPAEMKALDAAGARAIREEVAIEREYCCR